MTSLTPPNRRLRVAVLMGGTSSERPVSLKTGSMIVQSLDPARYEVVAIDTRDVLRLQGVAPARIAPESVNKNDADPMAIASVPAGMEALDAAAQTLPPPPDVVFVALHGKGGEDGTVQGMLEMMGLPYTGSGVLASALAMDKAMTKRLFRSAGIPVIEDVQVRRGEEADGAALLARVQETLGFPVFVKPNAEGSSFGGTKVETQEGLLPAVVKALTYDPKVLIERYVQGVEITVGVLGNTHGDLLPLPIVEIVPKSAFYDFESKYADGGSEHIIPARLPETVTQRAQELAVQCHNLLGCRGMSRTDMLVVGETLSVLEVNTIPGMTPTSLLPQAAAHAGISFAQLLDRFLTAALEDRS
ncbi:MAG: D-alanine--D-alanine ligase [Chthonomonadaceae bacterium]|nr:D-alanine--D-alanine ligase [Chthonomonadaceae bacterium]